MPTVIYAVGNMAIKEKNLQYLLHLFAMVAHKVQLKLATFSKGADIQKARLLSLGADG